MTCRCPRRPCLPRGSVCGPECELPARRAWAVGARSALGKRPIPPGLDGAVPELLAAYLRGRRAGGAPASQED